MQWLLGIVDDWRSGTRHGQLIVLGLLLGCVAVSLVISLIDYRLFPIAGFFLWLLLGSLLLRFGPVLVLALAAVAAGSLTRLGAGEVTGGRVASIVLLLLCGCLVLYASGRQRSGLPSHLSGAMLAELRDRLDAQGRVPPLPEGWVCETAMIAAHGVGYAGDFMVADLAREGDRLDLALVDVVGKGVQAAPSALLLAGALGGLVGSVDGRQMFDAANEFLLRQDSDDAFATAAHVRLNLETAEYVVISAGHPPALRWRAAAGTWVPDPAQGLALGVQPHPELNASHDVLEPGDALLFYTDGVVETRGGDIEDGIAWLQETAAAAMARGVEGAARRIVRHVPRGDDDRAVLLISRTRTAG